MQLNVHGKTPSLTSIRTTAACDYHAAQGHDDPRPMFGSTLATCGGVWRSLHNNFHDSEPSETLLRSQSMSLSHLSTLPGNRVRASRCSFRLQRSVTWGDTQPTCTWHDVQLDPTLYIPALNPPSPPHRLVALQRDCHPHILKQGPASSCCSGFSAQGLSPLHVPVAAHCGPLVQASRR
jgi:hypothetical protein